MVKVSSMIALGQLPPLPYKVYVLSGDTLHAHDAVVSTVNTAYAKQKTITLSLLRPWTATIRVAFDLRWGTGPGATVYGRIYKNGVAFGTERSTGLNTWTTYTEDLSFSESDTLELWDRTTVADTTVEIRNFRVLGTSADAGSLQDEPFKGANS